jgi:hypothetical protein
MTDQQTAARLQAALQNRAEIAMSSTDTSRELDRLRDSMPPVRTQRRRQILVAAAAVVAIVAGAVGLGLGLTGGGSAGTVTPAQPPGGTTAPADFPVGTYERPGSQPHAELDLAATGATLRRPNELLTSRLTFPAAGEVQFNCISGNHAPCASPCLYSYRLAGPTLTLALLRKSAECPANDFIAQAPWRLVGSETPADYPTGSWVRTGSHAQATLTFSDAPSARLQDQSGFNNEPLTFPAAHAMIFGASQPPDYCPRSDTYRYSLANGVLRFTVVGHATCARRLNFLTSGSWRRTSS